MRHKTRKGQVSSGEAIGILLLDTSVPFVPGDVANATSYAFPVRFQKVEAEVVATAKQMAAEHEQLRALLLECSLLPPYGRAVKAAVNLPLFDYMTLINFVFSAVVKQAYTGFI
ncbi:MAG: hypothetical protein LJE94_10255 [Deltaproteobacteria bacterium]|nr:hypothetical protein [Deltaproteobacteria bacterium]